jgi:hypothetical protein
VVSVCVVVNMDSDRRRGIRHMEVCALGEVVDGLLLYVSNGSWCVFCVFRARNRTASRDRRLIPFAGLPLPEKPKKILSVSCCCLVRDGNSTYLAWEGEECRHAEKN